MFNTNCWRIEKSKSFNRNYYVNLETGKSQWGLPQNFEDKMLGKDWEKHRSNSKDKIYYERVSEGKTQWEEPPDEDDQETLPMGWEIHFSTKCNNIYYKNVATGHTQWEHPKEEVNKKLWREKEDAKIKDEQEKELYRIRMLKENFDKQQRLDAEKKKQELHDKLIAQQIHDEFVAQKLRERVQQEDWEKKEIERKAKIAIDEQKQKEKEDAEWKLTLKKSPQNNRNNPHDVIFNWPCENYDYKGNWSLTSDKGVKNTGSYEFDPKTMKITSRFNGKQDKIASVMITKCMCPVSAFVNKRADDFPFSEIKVILGSIQDLIQTKASDNRQKVFVLPSQLNGAEYPSPDFIVGKLQSYMSDRTGGPAGQLAADPGVAQFIIDNAANNDTELFDHDSGINNVRLMGDIPGITLKNGYLQVKDDANISEFENKISQMTVLGVRDVPVRGLMSGGQREFFYADHTVDLIYGSAVPIQSDPDPKSPYYDRYAPYYGNSDHPTVRRIANLTLFAQYVGSFRLAILRGNCNIYLMLLGGGVFSNRFDDIKDAISSAYNYMKERLKRADVKVFVLVWEGNVGKNEPRAKEELRAFNLLK